jgi:hypothetical protein
MRSFVILGTLLAAAAAGCGVADDRPEVDVAGLSVTMTWSDGGTRHMTIAVPQDIPCEGHSDEFLGQSGIECTSKPWTLTVDGVALPTSPVRCTSAHETLFGHIDKDCDGGSVFATLDDSGDGDVQIVATTESDDNQVALRGVRQTYSWTQVSPYHSVVAPGIVRVDGIEPGGGYLKAYFTGPGGTKIQGSADTTGRDPRELTLKTDVDVIDGEYSVVVHGFTHVDGFNVAVPIRGKLTVANE